MITRSIDSNHDWNFGKGKQDYLAENDALAQNIQTRIMSFLNDCFFDLAAGIDWFNFLGSKNIVGLRLAVSGVILQTTGVNELNELSFELDANRSLLIQYSVTSAWSNTVNGTANLG